MKLTTAFSFALVYLCCALVVRADSFGSGANTFDIEFVTVGNPGNVADTTGSPNPAGSVSYAYRIGKYEISEQMIDKANAEGQLGIERYIDSPGGPNKPAIFISWNEAARFVNWLNVTSGSVPAYKFVQQPGEAGYSTTENIDIWAPNDPGYNANNLYRNSLAKYFLPSVDEWYKAAYFDPHNGVYYDYPTGSDNVPDGIDFQGDPNFDALFDDGGVDLPHDIYDVGVLSPYGTAGQGGSVLEWEETSFDLSNSSGTSPRGIRGGVFYAPSSWFLSSERDFWDANPYVEPLHEGFRVASIAVPEPSSALLGTLASAAMLWRRRR